MSRIARAEDKVNPAVNGGLRPARRLVSLGMPVGCGRLNAEGDPDGRDRRWNGWQETTCGQIRYRPGDAVYAVTGTAYDVLDVDPRNGGVESFEAMAADLGDNGPRVYCRVATPRGGQHLYIAPLGIGSHNGIAPGIDLKGGYADGTGRGFVYFVPTERYGKTYRLLMRPQPVNGDSCSEDIREWASAQQDALAAVNGNGSGRQEPEKLWAAVLRAESGHQRAALLRYVHELERSGLSRSAITIMLRGMLPSVPCLDAKKLGPWYPAKGGDPDKWIKNLLHKPGQVVGDAAPGEIPRIQPIRPHGMRNFTEIKRRRVRWIWKGYLARGEITVLDGEKGCGKSLVVEDISARLSTGRPMPGEESGHGEVICSAIFTVESSPETEIGPRLDAAGADGSRIWVPELEKRQRGKRVKAALELGPCE
jgi:hypothetical protein